MFNHEICSPIKIPSNARVEREFAIQLQTASASSTRISAAIFVPLPTLARLEMPGVARRNINPPAPLQFVARRYHPNVNLLRIGNRQHARLVVQYAPGDAQLADFILLPLDLRLSGLPALFLAILGRNQAAHDNESQQPQERKLPPAAAR